MVRGRSILSFVALASACGDNGGGAATDAAVDDAAVVLTDASATLDAMPERFDLDLVVEPGGVAVWIAEPPEWGCGPIESFPQPGACVEYGHVFRDCHVDRCLERVAVERGGAELAAASLSGWWWFTTYVAVPDMFAGGDVELVVEGCGGTVRVPLDRSVATTAPTLTDLTFEDDEVRGTVSGATGATGLVASAFDTPEGRFTPTCHAPGATALRVWLPNGGLWTAELDIRAVVARPPVATPWGVARRWIATRGTAATVAVLGTGGGPTWTIGTMPASATTLTIDGGAPVAIAPILGFRATPAGTRLSLTGAVAYTAGETTDTLTIDRPDGRYAGTFPHVTPANDLDLSLDGDTRLALTVGPVTLTHETDPARTHVVTLALDVTHPIVPRPVP